MIQEISCFGKKAAEVLDGESVGVTIEEAEVLGMKPFVEERGWGVNAQAIFDLDTEFILLLKYLPISLQEPQEQNQEVLADMA